jgi:predicted  nucleic acid-binding Zn-ribbon protein
MKINHEETTIVTRCPICGRTNFIKVNDADYWDWQDGALAQDAFPYLSADEREMLISGICPTCWANTFGDLEEEEDPATYEFEPGRVYWDEMAANP